ncbi:hypothetical protein niasHT_016491 [Heterodera trifolii]|uniref:Uncharacterized protein n=1 Tax=Heterodera trifolii TaxID=157864 RepID=A0ABD2KZE7_9BILA
MNRLFFWVVDQQNYINGGWIYGGIIREIEYQVRERNKIIKLFYGNSSSSASSSSSSSSDSDENYLEKIKNQIFGKSAKSAKSSKKQDEEEIIFDAQERQLMRQILAEFKITATKIDEPFRDLLFYMYFNQKLLHLLNENGEVQKYLAKISDLSNKNADQLQQKMPTNLFDRHDYIHKWLGWVTEYAESWLAKLISLAIRIGTLNMDNAREPFANCICRHFDPVKGNSDFDENYTVEDDGFTMAIHKRNEIDEIATKSEQTQQQYLDKIVAQSLALRNILMILAEEANNDFTFESSLKGTSSSSSTSYLTTIISKTLHPLLIKNVHSNHQQLVHHLATLILFFHRIFEMVAVPQIWLLNKFSVGTELKQLKRIYETTIKALHNIENEWDKEQKAISDNDDDIASSVNNR